MYYIDDTTGEIIGQELSDKTKKGKERPWRWYKMKSQTLAEVFKELKEFRRADGVARCADVLIFSVNEDGKKKLKETNFCRERLCATCQWRRSLRTHADVSRIVDAMGDSWRFLFMTLTVKNCKPEELGATLDELQASWERFSKLKEIRKAFDGTFRTVEVKHNIETNEYHPHMHVLCAVKPTYFRGKTYISNKPTYRYTGSPDDVHKQFWLIKRENSQLVKLWLRSIRADGLYDNGLDGQKHVICDIRRIRGTMGKVIAEVAKYAVKPDEVINEFDWAFTVDTVELLHRVLAGRRFISYSGIFKKIKKELGIQDEEKADLLHVDDENTDVAEEGKTIKYTWYSVYNQYLG